MSFTLSNVNPRDAGLLSRPGVRVVADPYVPEFGPEPTERQIICWKLFGRFCGQPYPRRERVAYLLPDGVIRLHPESFRLLREKFSQAAVVKFA